MTFILYFIIVLFATCIGASVGLSGGVIIKPLFDLVSVHKADSISFFSSIAIVSMACVSIYKQYKNKAQFNFQITIFLALGSIVGGYTGNYLFSHVFNIFQEATKGIQNFLLCTVLSILLIYTVNKDKIKTHRLKNTFVIFFVGLLMGNLSVFLGIGGGPLNLAILSLLFSFTSKESVVLSISIIFFSQVSKLTTLFLENQFAIYDTSVIPYIIIAAFIGGNIGSQINKKMSNKQVDKLYILTLFGLILLTLFNILNQII